MRTVEEFRRGPQRLVEAAELVSPVVGAPETMMRGYYRAASGPGWALVGDAGHFKHPTTGQGIGDALAQAEHVAQELLDGGDLAGYEQWRADRSAEAYEFSYRAARLPETQTAARYAGLAAAFGARTVELNLAPTLADAPFDEVHTGPASVTVPRWVEDLLA